MQVNISLSITYDQVAANVTSFLDNFVRDITLAVPGLQKERVKINSISAGSVIVNFEILPDTTASTNTTTPLISPTQAISQLQQQLSDPNSPVNQNGTYAKYADTQSLQYTYVCSDGTTILNGDASKCPAPTPTPGPNNNNGNGSDNGGSSSNKNMIIGIAVGVGGGILLLLGVAYVVMKKKQSNTVQHTKTISYTGEAVDLPAIRPSSASMMKPTSPSETNDAHTNMLNVLTSNPVVAHSASFDQGHTNRETVM